ncbi:hypothetical protein [Paenibacillus sp. TY11]|uniref:hypothetical protein n=1 Tax=Paenibacillus sp. TY11 TaxID=3448633 RepID=UPI004039A58C
MSEQSNLLYELENLAMELVVLMLQTQRQMKKGVFKDQIINNINALVDGFVTLNDTLNNHVYMNIYGNLDAFFRQISEVFEKIILAYETDNSEIIRTLYNQELIPKFIGLKNELTNEIDNSTGLKSIIISGISLISSKIIDLIDFSKVRIVAFISDEPSYIGKFIDDIPVLNSQDVKEICVKFLIITDNYSCDCISEIVNLKRFLETNYDFEIFRAYDDLKLYEIDNNKMNGFITGLSYAEVGVDVNEIQPYNVVNLAVSSQDLYYDHQWIKSIVGEMEFQFAFIGLSYYSFEYDLSKSSLKNRVNVYSSLFKSENNLEDEYSAIEFQENVDKIFKPNFIENIYNILKVVSETRWENFVKRQMSEDDMKNGKYLAYRDGAKDYPTTVVYNKGILRGMLNILQENNIKPILLVCPVSKYYHQFFPPRIKEEFKKNVEMILEEFNVHIIDLFESDKFMDTDFYDASHLNKEGAKKLTLFLRGYLDNLFYGETKNRKTSDCKE